MIILSANNITKAYGVDVILSGISFHINQGDRVGVIGANGAGKTTLLNILSGDMPRDEGDVFISSDTTIGYLKQSDEFSSDKTLYEEVSSIFVHMEVLEKEMGELSVEIGEKSQNGEDVEKKIQQLHLMQEEYERKNGYTYKSEINGILNSMAFTEDFFEKKISTLSGGERTRLSLACLLLKKPDLLFLDEPTNHLDIGTIKWLEQYLKGYKGTIVLISHDRYFLDQTVNKIFELENHKMYIYEGNYSTFAEKKRQRLDDEMRKYDQQQKEIDRQEEIIRRFKQHGTEKLAKRAQSREKQLAKIDVLEKPTVPTGKIKIHFKQNFKSGNDVLKAQDLSMSFGHGQNKKHLFNNVDFDIKRGERICIVGPNGVGKTTLLKIMMQTLEPDGGHLKTGHNVAFGYYDQGQKLLNFNNTVFEEMKDSYRLYSDTEMRSILGRFLFRNEAVFLNVASLSGGEKARLTLLKLMLSGANVIILDEPTNHLDINSKEIVEDALLDFPGTVIVVSHDRYFLNKVPTRIFELTQNGIDSYLGSYDYYVEKKQSIDSGKKYLEELSKIQSSSETEGERSEKIVDSGLQRKINKENEAKDRKKERDIKKYEEEISKIEGEIGIYEAEMCKESVFTNHVLASEYNEKVEISKNKLEKVYEEWLKLQD
ncbi:MAG TPA: ABC-F family ATP-binding cassette domain-containing protein [Anaerovoracaceae bacterium]|nr:ABC-F family ATP-binding cassette domain-containing protein [Anaerovoracaceae bacterium]